MATKWLPIDKAIVSSLTGNDKTILNRIEELSNETIPNDDKTLTEFKTYQRQVSKNFNTAISISPFFKGDGSYDDFTYTYFLGAFSDKYRFTKGSGSSIIAERFGLGIEIELKVTNLKTSIKGGFASIGAAIDMELADASYKYHIRSLPDGDFNTLLPPIGQFNSEAIEKFKLLVNKLKQLYKSANGNIDLVAIEILLDEAPMNSNGANAASYYFAAKRLLDDQTLSDAVLSARSSPGRYNEDAIQYVYARCGVKSLNEKPTSTSKDAAKKLINN
ncbi:hypothetical protein [Flavihumibacter petaseus]|uniref:Uncharacterized protein n=1 Tax=Flavihumibacter petaseus NBRC 106054 TaxID=1220578 RepID=A0A0E9N416_9BACT|nr:hypothetical protein [Flavihumibacter petaseus]GAO44110.1 hypothetical protein FPE01S_03_01490 [Flavihumibacter petaseus NBRC 106054]